MEHLRTVLPPPVLDSPSICEEEGVELLEALTYLNILSAFKLNNKLLSALITLLIIGLVASITRSFDRVKNYICYACKI